MELQAIPFTAIAEYSRIYALRDFDDFAYIIRAMDVVYMDLNQAIQKKEGDKNGSANTDAKNHNKR